MDVLDITTVGPSSTNGPAAPTSPATMGPGGGPSHFETIGLPIILLFVVALVFFLIHAAVNWLPESKHWKRLTGTSTSEDDDRATFLMKRKNSLRMKLKRYKEGAKSQGYDGRGGVSTGNISKDDFDYIPRHSLINLTKEEEKKSPRQTPSPTVEAKMKRSSIEGEVHISVAHFQNKAFEDDLDHDLDIGSKVTDQKPCANNNLTQYRRSAEFYSAFTLPPIDEVRSQDSVLVHAAPDTCVDPVPPKRHRARNKDVQYNDPVNYSQPIPPRRKDRILVNSNLNEKREHPMHKSTDDIRNQNINIDSRRHLKHNPDMHASADNLRMLSERGVLPAMSKSSDDITLHNMTLYTENHEKNMPRKNCHYAENNLNNQRNSLSNGKHRQSYRNVRTKNAAPFPPTSNNYGNVPPNKYAAPLPPERSGYPQTAPLTGHFLIGQGAILPVESYTTQNINKSNIRPTAEYQGSAHV